jgi:1-acyl-sn-glycerol-3-phosphate acyltransferase
MKPTFGARARSVAYVIWINGWLAILGLGCLPLLLGPRRGVLWAARLWARLSIWGLAAIVGLKVEVRGLQYRPTGAALIAAKHQSMLDTIAPFVVLDDPCFVWKQELMRFPIYGWYVAKSGMIPIDRSAGSKAVRALRAAALDRLADDRQILIFPEGTRQQPDAEPAYKPGVAALYRDLGFACTPMATNAGLFWPPTGKLLRPGVAVFEFLEPIPPDLKRPEFMQLLEARIEAATNALVAEGRGA